MTLVRFQRNDTLIHGFREQFPPLFAGLHAGRKNALFILNRCNWL